MSQDQGQLAVNMAGGKKIFEFYFILSSEIMENISAIKIVSIYSEMIWYHFTVD